MTRSKLGNFYRTTIPSPVRRALRLKPGDWLVYEISGRSVVLTNRRVAIRIRDPFRVFREWHSDADTKGYARL